MRPLKGLVTGVEGSTLVIRLESGLTVRLPARNGEEKWDSVQVAFDYTHNRAAEVISTGKDETAALDEIELFDEKEMPDPEETDDTAAEFEEVYVKHDCDGECTECWGCWAQGLWSSPSES